MNPSPTPPRLVVCEWLTPRQIEMNLKATTKDDLLAELVAKIPEFDSQPEARQTLLKALIEREELYSTGVGEGVAFPHSRNALVGLVDKPVLVFGRHPEGIAYGAEDGVPARLFFLLVAPNVSLHLQILARLGRLMRDPRLRRALLAADQPENAIELLKQAEATL